MSLARKQTLAAVVLIGLFVWPLVHRALVYHYDISPWRFCGFSMYCVPRRIVNVTLHQPDGTLVALNEGSPEDRILWRYGRAWLAWGPHDPDKNLWQSLRKENPALRRHAIVVREWRLDRRSSRIVQTTYGYRFPEE